MTSQISIVNRALLSIGARAQVSNINPSDGSTEGNAASVLFTPTFENLARAARWNCLRAQATLSLLAAATGTPENPNGTTMPLPPTPWLYAYAYPSNCLAMRFLVPSLPTGANGIPVTGGAVASPIFVPNGGQIPFAVGNATDSSNSPITVILTNQSQAQAVYTINQPNPQIWDSMFQAAMVASLAAYFVPALSLDMPLMKMSIESADRLITLARVADGDEGVTSQNREASWITARSAGYGYGCGYSNSNFNWNSYTDMCWPGGAY